MTGLTNYLHNSRQKTHVPGKKNLVTYYNMQADKPVIRSMITENVQQNLGGMGLDLSKYSLFKTHQQRRRNVTTLKMEL